MRNVLLIWLIAFAFESPVSKEETVLICTGNSAYAYHKEYCRGLKRCSREVIRVSKKEAVEQYGMKKACGYCY